MSNFSPSAFEKIVSDSVQTLGTLMELRRALTDTEVVVLSHDRLLALGDDRHVVEFTTSEMVISTMLLLVHTFAIGGNERAAESVTSALIDWQSADPGALSSVLAKMLAATSAAMACTDKHGCPCYGCCQGEMDLRAMEGGR